MGLKQIAEQLRNAAKNKVAVAPIRDEIGKDNISDAYEIQSINTKHKLYYGSRIVGKKIGLTSFAVQKQLGVDQPDFGVLFDDMEVLNGLSISVDQLMQPKVEAEIAFVLKHDLDHGHLNIKDVIGAIDYCLPAIEIVGSRVKDWNIGITDTIADNASASHFVIGHSPKYLCDFDVINCSMKMTSNGSIVSEGTGKDCLGSPINAVLWLAKKMQEFKQPLRAGEILLSGAMGPMFSVIAGHHIEATFEGLGNVSVSFT